MLQLDFSSTKILIYAEKLFFKKRHGKIAKSISSPCYISPSSPENREKVIFSFRLEWVFHIMPNFKKEFHPDKFFFRSSPFIFRDEFHQTWNKLLVFWFKWDALTWFRRTQTSGLQILLILHHFSTYGQKNIKIKFI